MNYDASTTVIVVLIAMGSPAVAPAMKESGSRWLVGVLVMMMVAVIGGLAQIEVARINSSAIIHAAEMSHESRSEVVPDRTAAARHPLKPRARVPE
jgi:hypothetical protein